VAENEALNEVAHAMHGLGGIILSLLVLAHIGAALYHHFKLKDETLKRMSLKG
jgi:cytochrome b561